MTTHTVQWATESRLPVSPDLTHYWVQIETPAGEYVAANVVPLTARSQAFTLPPGEYVESVAGSNADGTVREGRISRPFSVGNGPVGKPFPFPIWADAPEPPEPPDPSAPDKTAWDAGMVEWGIVHGDTLSTEQSIDFMLNHVYYDMARCMYQIADYTESPEPWNTYAKQAAVFFRDQYAGPNNGAVPGYENFTHGLRMDFERTGDAESKRVAILLSQNAMYAQDWVEPASVASHARSREVAYAILGYINAEKLGEAKRDIRARYVTQSYDYCRQWQDVAAWGTGQVSPFMAGITAQALIADWEETQDARCLPAMLEIAEFFWVRGYHAETHSLYYQINQADTADGGPQLNPAPDLNMICAPLYGWLWAQTGDVVHRDRFDELLLGQANAYLAQGKQFDQNYWWSFEGMRWREATPNPD
jgi:hypothetical protein